jgi:hypothetical protein
MSCFVAAVAQTAFFRPHPVASRLAQRLCFGSTATQTNYRRATLEAPANAGTEGVRRSSFVPGRKVIPSMFSIVRTSRCDGGRTTMVFSMPCALFPSAQRGRGAHVPFWNSQSGIVEWASLPASTPCLTAKNRGPKMVFRDVAPFSVVSRSQGLLVTSHQLRFTIHQSRP